jgi:MFS family permease
VNVLFTGYLSQVQSTLPVYFNQFVRAETTGEGLSEGVLSLLFTGHIVLAVICQMPITRFLRAFTYPRALMVSACLWGLGFALVDLASWPRFSPVWWAAAALGVMALATVAYTPVSSSLVVMLAPEAQRGVYLSINSMCWAVGYFIGPPLGGWALDQGPIALHIFWLTMALSALPALLILGWLETHLHP